MKVVVTGVKEEGVSTAAAAIVGEEPREGGSGLYWKPVVPTKANLCIYDFPGFPKVSNKLEKAKELIVFQIHRQINLVVLCIPMTSSKEHLEFTPHIKYLERLCEVDSSILNNTVIALTHANEMQAGQNDLFRMSFQQFFQSEVEKWKDQITTALQHVLFVDEDFAKKIPVIPVGNSDPTINLSDNRTATNYPWLSELLLQIMPATKPQGLPTLIKVNRKQLKDHPDQYRDPDRARELIVEAQCSLFSQIGLRDMQHPGQAIGLILGVRETQDWA